MIINFNFNNLLIITLLIFIVPITTLSSDFPFNNIQKTSEYVLIGKDLWNIKNEQLAGKEWAPLCTQSAYYGGPVARLIKNQSGKIFCYWNEPSHGFAKRHPSIFAPYKQCKSPSVCLPKNTILSSDYRRVVYIKDGNIWRAEFDWSSGQLKNSTHVTSIGLFSGKEFLVWYENKLFVKTDFSDEKSIARVDLVSGQIDEMNALNIFDQKWIKSNPSGFLIIGSDNDYIHLYNVKTGVKSKITNKIDVPGAPPIVRRSALIRKNTQLEWIDDYTAVTNPRQYIAKFDFKNNKTSIIKSNSNAHIKLNGILPGKKYLDISEFFPATTSSDIKYVSRQLLNISNGIRIDLPVDPESKGVWLDESKYLYSVKKGNISDIGTWIYEVNSKKKNKIVQIPAHIYSDRTKVAYFPERNEILFSSLAGGKYIHKAKLDGSETSKITTFTSGHNNSFARINTDHIDLGIGTSNSNLWKTVVTAQALTSTSESSSTSIETTSQTSGSNSPTENEGNSEHLPGNLPTTDEVLSPVEEAIDEVEDTVNRVKNIFNRF